MHACLCLKRTPTARTKIHMCILSQGLGQGGLRNKRERAMWPRNYVGCLQGRPPPLQGRGWEGGEKFSDLGEGKTERNIAGGTRWAWRRLGLQKPRGGGECGGMCSATKAPSSPSSSLMLPPKVGVSGQIQVAVVLCGLTLAGYAHWHCPLPAWFPTLRPSFSSTW